ncbi:MAG: expansin EXLX1 family cellulose-binding protein [Minicystis sp.]
MRRTSAIFMAAVAALFAGACGSGGNQAGTGAGSTGNGASTPGPACTTTPEQHTGDGTYYDADGSGNCSFDPTGDLMVGAMNHTDYADSAACGACAHLVGPSGEVTVRIVDQCPECQPGDIDLSPDAFAKLADLSLGRIKINWTYVPCDVDGPIVYHFKEGSNQWWTAVQIRGARYAIAKLEVQKDGQYVEVNRVDYNYFVDDSGMGPGPYAFRVTDVNGAVLTDTGIPFTEAGDAPGAAQFPACD